MPLTEISFVLTKAFTEKVKISNYLKFISNNGFSFPSKILQGSQGQERCVVSKYKVTHKV